MVSKLTYGLILLGSICKGSYCYDGEITSLERPEMCVFPNSDRVMLPKIDCDWSWTWLQNARFYFTMLWNELFFPVTVKYYNVKIMNKEDEKCMTYKKGPEEPYIDSMDCDSEDSDYWLVSDDGQILLQDSIRDPDTYGIHGPSFVHLGIACGPANPEEPQPYTFKSEIKTDADMDYKCFLMNMDHARFYSQRFHILNNESEIVVTNYPYNWNRFDFDYDTGVCLVMKGGAVQVEKPDKEKLCEGKKATKGQHWELQADEFNITYFGLLLNPEVNYLE